MNETNQVEEQLRSWILRRPSAGVKSKLFGHVAREQEQISWNRALPWLVPAAACLIAAFVLFKTEKSPGFLRGTTNSAPVFFAMIGSNSVITPLPEQPFQFASAAGNMQWNVWSKTSFHTTNEQLWTGSRDGSAPSSTTNQLQ